MTWLSWARELQAISQTGLTFTTDDYNRGRYRRLAEIAAEIVEKHAGLPVEPTVENFLVQPGYATPKVDVRGERLPGRGDGIDLFRRGAKPELAVGPSTATLQVDATPLQPKIALSRRQTRC